MALSAYSGEDLEAMEERLKQLSDYLMTEEESEGDDDEHLPLSDLVGVLGEIGERVKVDKLIKVCHTHTHSTLLMDYSQLHLHCNLTSVNLVVSTMSPPCHWL